MFHDILRGTARLSLLIGLTVFAVAACGGGGGGGGGGDDGDDGDGELLILTATGTHISPEGTWEGCYSADGFDHERTLVFAGESVTETVIDYFGTANGSCGGTAETPSSGTGDLHTVGDALLEDWMDGTAYASGPLEADGSGNLADPPTATQISSNNGNNTKALFIDDTATPLRLYFASQYPTALTDCAEVSGYAQCLHTTPPAQTVTRT